MSGSESVGEETVEAALEVVNPGGRPDVLRDAAKGWRQMAHDVEGLFKALNTEVDGMVGVTWRGPAAVAFHSHWCELKSVIDKALPDFEDAATGLDDAAKNIEEVNGEIHNIYAEIGISIGVSALTSVVTMGFSAAAGAARAAQLVARAVEWAGRLGQILEKIALSFRWLYNSGRAGKFVMEALANWAGGTASGMVSNKLAGDGWRVQDNIVGGLAGATIGTGAGKGVETMMRTGITRDFAAGAAGGAAGGVSGDVINAGLNGENVSPTGLGISAVTGGAGGGAGGVSVGMHDAFTPHMSEGQKAAVDGQVNTSVPIIGGAVANDAKNSATDPGHAGAAQDAQQTSRDAHRSSQRLAGSSADKIKEDFG